MRCRSFGSTVDVQPGVTRRLAKIVVAINHIPTPVGADGPGRPRRPLRRPAVSTPSMTGRACRGRGNGNAGASRATDGRTSTAPINTERSGGEAHGHHLFRRRFAVCVRSSRPRGQSLLVTWIVIGPEIVFVGSSLRKHAGRRTLARAGCVAAYSAAFPWIETGYRTGRAPLWLRCLTPLQTPARREMANSPAAASPQVCHEGCTRVRMIPDRNAAPPSNVSASCSRQSAAPTCGPGSRATGGRTL